MADEIREVVVTDIKVHFWSMVVLLIEWTIAAIPAMVILYIVVLAISLGLDAVFGPSWHWWTARSV